MTISHGTLNGLIFYANVVSISGLTRLQNCSIHPILSIFIAWVNLDFGVETCFYSGMNTYQKTWLQFAFPLYIWLLVGAIIIASHYLTTVMKMFGRNNMALLATLFLLSYTKILKTIITALSFTEVLQGSAENRNVPLMPYKVWTYDSNIEYLKGKHVPLFAVTLVLLIFLFLPYILLLTFGQCVNSTPVRTRCVLRCIRSSAFISIMDAYQAPYTKKHRYWTGLMLLTRCALFLGFVASYNDDENSYITVLVLTAVYIFTLKMTCAMKVDKNKYMNILEVCFLVNLLIISATLYSSRDSRSGTICKCTSASISVSMVIFIGILFYHSYLKISNTMWYASIKAATLKKWQTMNHHADPLEDDNPPNVMQQMPTTTSVELREALLHVGSGEDQ